MSLPKPWHEIGQHQMLPQLTHDELVRFDMVGQLNTFAAQRLAPRVRTAYETRVVNAWRMRHGHAPKDRHEVADALAPDADYRSWSLVRRNTMEMRQHAGRRVMLRQARNLRDRAAAFNAGANTLQLDESLPVPRYVSAVDTHLMPGGYAAEHLQGDVVNPANYDAGLFATVGGSAGPWNDAAGRALVNWLREQHPEFRPRRIVDLGCGVGHNTLPLRAAYPQAEIIAIDVAAPMLRYGHARARALGVDDVLFRQEDATHTSIASGSCDLVYTTMVLHETSHEALPKIMVEAQRLLRAGGLTIHLEQPPYRGLEPFEQFMRDWDGRYNNEPFWSAMHETFVPELLERAGFAPQRIFESRCSAASAGAAQEDFGRAPSWYAVGAWQTADGFAATGEHGS